MAVLQVTARLGAPVALREALHLDALLYSAHPDSGGKHLSRSDAEEEIRRPRLPVFSVTVGGEEAHVCSAEEWAPDASRRSGHITARLDGEDLDYRTRPVNSRSGPERDVMLRLPQVEAPWVRWYAVGDRRGVKKLLGKVQSVGAYRRAGYGHVLEWSVERMDDMLPEQVVLHGGRARRHLPAAWCEAPEIVDEGAVRHPYWHSSSIRPRVRRGTATGLADDARRRLAEAS